MNLDLQQANKQGQQQNPKLPKTPLKPETNTNSHTQGKCIGQRNQEKTLELNDDEKFTHQKLWHTTQEAFREETIALYASVRKSELKINELCADTT